MVVRLNRSIEQPEAAGIRGRRHDPIHLRGRELHWRFLSLTDANALYPGGAVGMRLLPGGPALNAMRLRSCSGRGALWLVAGIGLLACASAAVLGALFAGGNWEMVEGEVRTLHELIIVDPHGRGSFKMTFDHVGPQLVLVAPGGAATITLGFAQDDSTGVGLSGERSSLTAYVRAEVQRMEQGCSSELRASFLSSRVLLAFHDEKSSALAGIAVAGQVDAEVDLGSGRSEVARGPSAEIFLSAVQPGRTFSEAMLRMVAMPGVLALMGDLDELRRIGLHAIANGNAEIGAWGYLAGSRTHDPASSGAALEIEDEGARLRLTSESAGTVIKAGD